MSAKIQWTKARYVAAAIAFVGVIALFERLYFLVQAAERRGTVVEVVGNDERCTAKVGYDCTKFRAAVRLKDPQESLIALDSGEAKGHNAPVAQAKHQKGQEVTVFVDPDDPYSPVEKSLRKELQMPFILLVVAALVWFASATIFPDEAARRRGDSFTP